VTSPRPLADSSQGTMGSGGSYRQVDTSVTATVEPATKAGEKPTIWSKFKVDASGAVSPLPRGFSISNP
jgi:hypothetical protein